MKTRWRIALGLGLAAGVVVVTLGMVSRDEPKYQGRRLGEWLRELPPPESGFAERHMPARFAVNFIGTNALPFLLESLQARDPEWKANTYHWLYNKCDINLIPRLADARRERAVSGFRALGRVAEPAIPQLEALATGDDKENAYYAINALQAIGTARTMPVIFHALTNDDAILREGALLSVGNFRSHAANAVPLLVRNLTTPQKDLRANAAKAIGDIGMAPEVAVPALIESLEDSYPLVRRYAIQALGNFGTNAISALPALQEIAEGEDEDLRRAARVATVRVRCTMRDGGIIRGPTDGKRIALLFAGHEYAESVEPLLAALDQRNARASFFLTGVFLGNPAFSNLVQRLADSPHYVGPHSDRHLLYCSWDSARTNLISEHEFQSDLFANVNKLPQIRGGYRRSSSYLLPPYEHYNRDVADWSRSAGWTIINYTPGTRAHADYTGEADANFTSSQAILDSILKREREDANGLNGYILVMHTGAGPGRKDKFHERLPELLDKLAERGYEFVTVNELLRPPFDPNAPRFRSGRR